MQTRKYPRTLTEAFGPYAHGSQIIERQPTHRADAIVLAASLVAAVVLLIIALAGWLPGGAA